MYQHIKSAAMMWLIQQFMWKKKYNHTFQWYDHKEADSLDVGFQENTWRLADKMTVIVWWGLLHSFVVIIYGKLDKL